jgi:hypothetical protein
VSRPRFLAVKPRKVGSPKAVVAAIYDQVGGVARVLVKFAGTVKQTTAYAYADNDCPDEISFAKVCALTEPGVTAGAEYLALLAGGVFLPVTPEKADLNALCADDARANGEAIATLLHALKDGKLSRPEAIRALKKIDDALRAITALRSVVDQEAKRQPE